MDENRLKVREFISKYISDDSFSDADNLFKHGYVNSMFALELVVFIENQFAIKIENNELNIANFESIDSISSLIDKKVR